MEYTEEQLEKDEAKFQKNLQNDQANFEDRLDTLEVVLLLLCHTHYLDFLPPSLSLLSSFFLSVCKYR